MTADPVHAGWAYAVWDQFQDLFPPCPVTTSAAVRASHETPRLGSDGQRGGCGTALPRDFTAPTYFSCTTDGGTTWSRPRQIVATRVNEQTIGNEILANRQTGVPYDFQLHRTRAAPDNIEMVFSTNHGGSWSKPQ